jgi:hypothetical protein
MEEEHIRGKEGRNGVHLREENVEGPPALSDSEEVTQEEDVRSTMICNSRPP